MSRVATGQVAASEVLMASESGCPIEVQKIEVGECDDAFDKDCKGTKLMPFHRALYDHKTGQSPNSPREQRGPGPHEDLRRPWVHRPQFKNRCSKEYIRFLVTSEKCSY
ncbi:dual oxidase [Trichonephila clavipes]|nr:dual oxidase [Trichonephila clavipes]